MFRIYEVAAGTIVVVHFAFLAFVLFGGFVAIRVRWARWAHLAAVGWAIAIVTVPRLLCPLTLAENWARRHAGLPSYSSGFIDRHVEGVLYPARYTPIVQLAVALLVLSSWVLWWRATRRRVGGPQGAV